MPSQPLRPLKKQARALLKDLEELHGKQGQNEPPKLPPKNQQELFRIAKELQEELQEMLRPGTCWPGLDWMEEINLWEVPGFPIELLEKLQKLQAQKRTCPPEKNHPPTPPVVKPAPKPRHNNVIMFPNEDPPTRKPAHQETHPPGDLPTRRPAYQET